MKFFQAFLIIVAATILFMLPVSEAVYDFRTDVREDIFTVTTEVGVTTGNVVLVKPIYGDDVSTLVISSNVSADSPAYSSYNGTTRLLALSGLSANTTRALTVDYDVAAFSSTSAIDNFMGVLYWFWMICIVGLIPAALIAIFTVRG